MKSIKSKTPQRFAKSASRTVSSKVVPGKKPKAAAAPASPPRKMRKDKEGHLIAINKFVSEYIVAHKRFPTQTEIGRNVGLSRESIRSLIKEIDLEEVAGSHITKIRTNEFIGAIFDHGQRGNVPAAKLWLQLVHKWVEKFGIDHSGEVALIISEEYRPALPKKTS